MRTELEGGNVTPEYLMSKVDKIAEKLEKDGYNWHYNNTSRDPKRAVATYVSDNGVKAYIMERTNKVTGKPFYVANRIDFNGNHHPLGTNADIRVLQNRVEAYNVQVVMGELQGDKRVLAGLEQKEGNAQKPQTLEDILEHARDRGVVLPKKHIEFMRTGLEAGKVTADYLVYKVDRIAEKYLANNPSWCTTILTDPNKPVAYYFNDHGDQARVFRRANEETGDQFFCAARVEGFGADMKFHDIATASTYDEVKNRVEGYYVGIAIKEVAKENKIAKEQKTEQKTTSQQVKPTTKLSSSTDSCGPSM